MKLHYYPETDSLYIKLKSTPGTETREVADGLVVDLDKQGESLASTSILPPSGSTSPGSKR